MSVVILVKFWTKKNRKTVGSPSPMTQLGIFYNNLGVRRYYDPMEQNSRYIDSEKIEDKVVSLRVR